MKPLVTTLILCAVEIFGLAGIATFAALLPDFISTWQLTGTQAGILSAVYYGAYVVAVPFLTSLTDRRDARAILIFGLLIGAAATFGFAGVASGFWSALVLRFMAGISLAAIYMPGLKLLSDHTEGPRQSRYVSFYTASFSLGASLSFFLAGQINLFWGWRPAFVAAGFLTVLGIVMVMPVAPGKKNDLKQIQESDPSRIRAVLKNRPAMAYILAYAAHMWELFSLRSWMVVFLAFSLSLQQDGAVFLQAATVVALINLIGLPASIGGNELCRRFGRKKTVTLMMLLSFALSLGVGFSAGLPYVWVVFISLLYGALVSSDSASLTAGAVSQASAYARGATLAVHSTLGFFAAFLGPLAVGIVLDLLRSDPRMAWGVAFAIMGAGCALGPLALRLLKPDH